MNVVADVVCRPAGTLDGWCRKRYQSFDGARGFRSVFTTRCPYTTAPTGRVTGGVAQGIWDINIHIADLRLLLMLSLLRLRCCVGWSLTSPFIFERTERSRPLTSSLVSKRLTRWCCLSRASTTHHPSLGLMLPTLVFGIVLPNLGVLMECCVFN